ncbi:MAG: SDR family oxidoreductase [Verrucomicrobiota bacterium]
MKVLFIGGSGIISTACVELALARGMQVSVLNRGNRPVPEGVSQIVADANDLDAAKSALGDAEWDVVLDFISFIPEDLEKRLEVFRGNLRQFFFISSASAYQRPCSHYLVTESTPLENRYWEYSRQKISCEERVMKALRDEQFPGTIIRPSLTFGDTQIPLAMGCWHAPFTMVKRLREGKPLIIPGDGSSLWTITHNTDFAKGLVGLFGNDGAIGHAFHITSDEVLTWDQIYQATAAAAGVGSPKFIHIASDFISACMPGKRGSLAGDKACSVVMDNSKIKRFVPDFLATTRYAEGIRKTVEWFDADPSRQVVDPETDAAYDKLIEVYEAGLENAKKAFEVPV